MRLVGSVDVGVVFRDLPAHSQPSGRHRQLIAVGEPHGDGFVGGVEGGIGLLSVLDIDACRRYVGLRRPVQVSIGEVGVGHEIGDAIGGTGLVGVVAGSPSFVEDASHFFRVRALVIRQCHVAPVAGGQRCARVVEEAIVEGIFQQAFHVPVHKLRVFAQIVQGR